jgi:hypothetical protein
MVMNVPNGFGQVPSVNKKIPEFGLTPADVDPGKKK